MPPCKRNASRQAGFRIGRFALSVSENFENRHIKIYELLFLFRQTRSLQERYHPKSWTQLGGGMGVPLGFLGPYGPLKEEVLKGPTPREVTFCKHMTDEVFCKQITDDKQATKRGPFQNYVALEWTLGACGPLWALAGRSPGGTYTPRRDLS